MNAPPRRTVRITAKQYTTGCAVILVTGTAPAQADPLIPLVATPNLQHTTPTPRAKHTAPKHTTVGALIVRVPPSAITNRFCQR
jgi:hypothetical protein